MARDCPAGRAWATIRCFDLSKETATMPTTIKVRQNGSLLVEGEDVTLMDWNGNPYPIVKRPFSLCRCGASTPSRSATAPTRRSDSRPPKPRVPRQSQDVQPSLTPRGDGVGARRRHGCQTLPLAWPRSRRQCPQTSERSLSDPGIRPVGPVTASRGARRRRRLPSRAGARSPPRARRDGPRGSAAPARARPS